MRRILFTLLLFISMLEAKETMRLDTHIRIIPKLISLCHANIKEPLTMAIVYDDNRKASAQTIASQMNALHSNRSGSLPFNAVALSVNELSAAKNIGFIYLLSMQQESVRKIVTLSQKLSIPTFSYNMNDLENGVLGSINLERSTVIYMSKSALRTGQFYCSDSLLSMVKFVP